MLGGTVVNEYWKMVSVVLMLPCKIHKPLIMDGDNIINLSILREVEFVTLP